MIQVPSFSAVQPEILPREQVLVEELPQSAGSQSIERISSAFEITREVTFQPLPALPERGRWHLSPTGTRLVEKLASGAGPQHGERKRRGYMGAPVPVVPSRPRTPAAPARSLPIAYVASNGVRYVWQPERGGWVVSKDTVLPGRELPAFPGTGKNAGRHSQVVALFRSIRTFFTRKKRHEGEEDEKERHGGGGHVGGGGGHSGGGGGWFWRGSGTHHHGTGGTGHTHGHGIGHGHGIAGGHGIGSGG